MISYPARLLAVLSALTVWRWMSAYAHNLELYADEAQYWFWSLDPDWGYYSKPPMVAWLIRLGTQLFGDGELGVRAATFFIWPLTATVIFLLVRRLYREEPWGEQAGFWAALIFATLPMVSLGSWVITTDGPFILFWSLSLYFLVRSLQTNLRRDWISLGICAGLGLMSKYSMVFFVPALLLFLLFSPARRGLLRTPNPYLAALAAFIVLVPNLAWNAAHHFVSYQHTAEISQLDRNLLHPDAFLEFFLAQFGVFGPITASILLLVTFRPRWLFADERTRLLAAFSLIPLGAFLTLSLLSRAFANWAAFAYAAGAGLVVVWLLTHQGKRKWLIIAVAVNVSIGAAMYHYRDVAHFFDIQLTRKTDPISRVSGNRALGEAVNTLLRSHPEARLLGDDRKTMAVLLYYTRATSIQSGHAAAFLNPTQEFRNHFALTADIKTRPQGQFILVSPYGHADRLPHWFSDVKVLPSIHINVLPDYTLKYQVWLLEDFKGY